jgi:ribosomal protein S18 acetylase RimI-like enzyme
LSDPELSDPRSSEAAIAAYLRHRSTSRGRSWERVGPFLATFAREGADPVPGFAMPDDAAEPSPGDVAELVSAYEQRGQLPRLRYLAPLAPGVEPSLRSAGFVVEDRSDIMTCGPPSAAQGSDPPGIELILPVSDAELAATREAQRQAYESPGQPGPEGLRGLRADIEAGAIAVLARDSHTGEPAGAGQCSIPFNGVTELFGIAVPGAFRQRGIARALTARLVNEAVAAGVQTVFLVPASEAVALGVYAPAGFTPTSEMLQMALGH